MLLPILLAPCIAMAAQQESKEIITPQGTFSVTSQKVAPVPQKIVPLDARRLQKIQELDKSAMQFLAVYRPAARPSLNSYDDAFRSWQLDRAARFSEDDVVMKLGAYLGNRLAEDFDMEWVEVTDEYGVVLAVRSRHFEVISYPFSSVEKRIEDKKYDFMAAVYYAVKDALASGPKKRSVQTAQ